MVVAPQFNYLSMLLPLKISELIHKQHNNFLWDKSMGRDKGGLGLPDVRSYNLSFNTTKLGNYRTKPGCTILPFFHNKWKIKI